MQPGAITIIIGFVLILHLCHGCPYFQLRNDNPKLPLGICYTGYIGYYISNKLMCNSNGDDIMIYTYNNSANCNGDAVISSQARFPSSVWECSNTDSCNILKYRQYESKNNTCENANDQFSEGVLVTNDCYVSPYIPLNINDFNSTQYTCNQISYTMHLYSQPDNMCSNSNGEATTVFTNNGCQTVPYLGTSPTYWQILQCKDYDELLQEQSTPATTTTPTTTISPQSTVNIISTNISVSPQSSANIIFTKFNVLLTIVCVCLEMIMTV
eukprot:168_1